MGASSLQSVTRQRRDCNLNRGPSAPESSMLTTRLLSHPPHCEVWGISNFISYVAAMMQPLLSVLWQLITTVEKIEEMGWELLQHPPHSPDLAPSDFHLFGPLKESLRGIKFENNEDDQQHAADKDFYAADL